MAERAKQRAQVGTELRGPDQRRVFPDFVTASTATPSLTGDPRAPAIGPAAHHDHSHGTYARCYGSYPNRSATSFGAAGRCPDVA